jgi:hypothetical protein
VALVAVSHQDRPDLRLEKLDLLGCKARTFGSNHTAGVNSEEEQQQSADRSKQRKNHNKGK